MRMQWLSKIFISLIYLAIVWVTPTLAAAQPTSYEETMLVDRVQLITEQVDLINSRIAQASEQFKKLIQEHNKAISELEIENASKNLLDKANLNITVSTSNLDSINIELTDSQQTINWLEKNIQEIKNQLNVLSIFGIKIDTNDEANIRRLHADLDYQQKLLHLEKTRIAALQKLRGIVNNILQLQQDQYNRLNATLKSRRLLHVKQQQVRDELAYQQQQNYWLQQLDALYARIEQIDPKKDQGAYTELERDIFYANENANYAYTQSLIARYKDQLQQMKLVVARSNSISLLNEIGDQLQILNKQLTKLKDVIDDRKVILDKHITSLTPKMKKNPKLSGYLNDLGGLAKKYQSSANIVDILSKNILEFRMTLDQALQVELSSRQGFPTFGVKTLLDLGKEMLLLPALTFQIVKSLSGYTIKSIQNAKSITWSALLIAEILLVFAYFFLQRVIDYLITKPSKWRERITTKWLSLQWLNRNLLDIFLIVNVIVALSILDVSLDNFYILFYLAFVWLIFKSIYIIARLCLVETTHDASGHDMRLFRRLRWLIWIGGIVTALTVFIHQLPMVYELRNLFDRLFLLLLLIVSIFLLRSWDVLPKLILSHMDSEHPYFQKSICLVGILIPLLMLANSVIGIFGYVNLIMTVSWYEGVFLLVLVGYLILRGLLSDGMEQLSRLLIQYVNNGWLWTEAFLKPIDKVLRITLFLVGWAVLFLLYGWDKQSPIVERLTRLLHYNLFNISNTSITPISMIELVVVISIFYWTAKWTREFVYRMLLSRTKDMGIRNSLAILSQYIVIIIGIFICMQVLGIDRSALALVTGMFAFGVGLGLRDLANNFACGFLILVERPIRVGDIVNINNIEGEVMSIGSRAIIIRTWDHMELVVPNAEIFYKSFTNLTAQDNIVRSVLNIKISRHDNPHEIRLLIQNVLNTHKEVLRDPPPEVYLREMSDVLLNFELRYYVNIRQIHSRTSVISSVLMEIWDVFTAHGIKPPYPQHEIFLNPALPTPHEE